MIAAAIAIGLGATACTSSTPSPPVSSGAIPPTIRMTCTSVGSNPVAGDLPSLRARARGIGADVIALRSAATTIRVDLRGVPPDQARALCTSPTVDVRGVVAPPVPASCTAAQCSAASVSNALQAAHLDPPPLTEASYTVLPASQRRSIASALARFDCVSTKDQKADPASYFVSCLNRTAYYLGPVIVSDADVAEATARPPSHGKRGWTILLSFTRQGSERLSQYTSAHNFGGASPAATVRRCSYATAPCANWVAFTVDGPIVSVPYNLEAINSGSIQISGLFGEAEAKQLAARLANPLPVPLQVDSLQTLH
jgi:preprotein translocase subunit SecD